MLMLNQYVGVGRLKSLEYKDLPSQKSVAKITLSIQRTFKNKDGVYESDIIPFVLFGEVAKAVKDNLLKEGDIIGIKGRISCPSENDRPEVVAEKVTFLSHPDTKDET